MSTARSDTAPVSDVVISKRTTVAVPIATAFSWFVETASLESWLCEKARVEPRVGGLYELFWEPSDPENDSTIGCRITVFSPPSLLGFQWRSPRQFKGFANAADPLTHVVVAFHPRSEGTEVHLVHTGWRSTADWLQAAEWQSGAWDYAFQALGQRGTQFGPPTQS